MRAASEQSLRFLVEKWLAPQPSIPVRVTEFSRTRRDGTRYVRVETQLPEGARSLFFFRHDDGCWCVFPPTADKARRPTHEPFAAAA
ncbi:MAG TPA: hypothetical protein VGL08_04340 [Paraburkholderia sp.]|jgi:hypothetical protein